MSWTDDMLRVCQQARAAVASARREASIKDEIGVRRRRKDTSVGDNYQGIGTRGYIPDDIDVISDDDHSPALPTGDSADRPARVSASQDRVSPAVGSRSRREMIDLLRASCGVYCADGGSVTLSIDRASWGRPEDTIRATLYWQTTLVEVEREWTGDNSILTSIGQELMDKMMDSTLSFDPSA